MELEKRAGGLNRNQLKYLAIVAMVVDHIAWAFVPTGSFLGQLMHFFGRLTGPTMAYFVAEGYVHTRNVKRYLFRLGLFALISWPFFVFFEYGCLPVIITVGAGYERSVRLIPAFGVIYTLFLGLLAIVIWDRTRLPKWGKFLCVVGLCLLSLFGDWMIFDILWCLFFFLYRDEPRKKWSSYCWVAAACCLSFYSAPWWKSLFMLGVFLVPVVIGRFYNGEPGKRSDWNRWFFYVFYPLHLFLLGVLKWYIL